MRLLAHRLTTVSIRILTATRLGARGRVRNGSLLAISLLLGLAGCNLDPEAAKLRFVDRGNQYYEQSKYKEASIMYRNTYRSIVPLS